MITNTYKMLEKYISRLVIVADVREELADFLDVEIDDERLEEINELINFYNEAINDLTQ